LVDCNGRCGAEEQGNGKAPVAAKPARKARRGTLA
jgi:hypothetical protein